MGDPLIGGHHPLIMAGDKQQLKDPLLLRPAPCQVKVLADVDEANLSIIFKYFYKDPKLKVKLHNCYHYHHHCNHPNYHNNFCHERPETQG